MDPTCEVCDEYVPLEIPSEMIVYRVGSGIANEPMRSGLAFDEKVTTECSNGHVVGALLISANRENLPEPLERRKQQMEKESERKTIEVRTSSRIIILLPHEAPVSKI